MQGIVGLAWRTACQYSSEGWAVYENGQTYDQHCWKQVCDRRRLLLAEPFGVSVSASNVVVGYALAWSCWKTIFSMSL